MLEQSIIFSSAASAMNEFRIHHDVNELLSLLHVRGGDGAEGYIDLLQKHRTPYVTTTVSAHSAKVAWTKTKSLIRMTKDVAVMPFESFRRLTFGIGSRQISGQISGVF